MHNPNESKLLDIYMKELKKCPPLSREEEQELAIKKDHPSIDKLIKSNLRFVITIAKQYSNCGISLPDLISIGNTGLITAVHRFDPSKNFKLITYAIWWIRQAILMAIAELSRPTSIPTTMSTNVGKLVRTIDKLEQILHRTPTINEIAKTMKMKSYMIERLIAIYNNPVQFEDTIEDQSQNMNNIFDNIDFNKISKTLSHKEKTIVKMYYDPNLPTLQDLSSQFKCSKERIRQIKQLALFKMKKELKHC